MWGCWRRLGRVRGVDLGAKGKIELQDVDAAGPLPFDILPLRHEFTTVKVLMPPQLGRGRKACK
jgi:hypothetical protein